MVILYQIAIILFWLFAASISKKHGKLWAFSAGLGIAFLICWHFPPESVKKRIRTEYVESLRVIEQQKEDK
jgi:hypothetical protein